MPSISLPSPFLDEAHLLRDMRAEAEAGHRLFRNPWERIDTLCLHQIAASSVPWRTVPSVEVPPSLRQYGSQTGPVSVPVRTGKLTRWLRTKVQWVIRVGEESEALLLHDLDFRMAHGHGWNRRSVGFEFEGFFAGVHELDRGRHRRFWCPKSDRGRKPMIPTERQLEAGRAACRYTIARVAEMGGQIRYVAAHRQSYRVKTSDPGALIWKGVAIPILEECGLEIGPVIGGRDIPEDWDPVRRAGVRY